MKKTRISKGRESSSGVFVGFHRQMPATQMVRVIRQGVNPRVLTSLADHIGMSKGDLFQAMRISSSTMHRRLADSRPLSAGESEKIVRLADIVRDASEALGDVARGRDWLRTPSMLLSGATPLSLLDTEPGAMEVRRLLQAIRYGSVA